MQSKLLSQTGGQRTFALIFKTGEEMVGALKTFAQTEKLAGSQFYAIGALSGATLAYFEWQTKKYRKNPVQEQVEVASLIGDIALGPDGKPAIHIHAVLGRPDGSALAGHLLEAHVRPTLELVLTESPTHLQKRHDPESGLNLIRLDTPS